MKALAAFARVHIQAHRNANVTLRVPKRELSYWSTATKRWTRATGRRPVYVGTSARDLRVATDVTVR
jgi:beta-glucosidase